MGEEKRHEETVPDEYLYHLGWTMNQLDPPFTREQLEEANMGGSNAGMFISILLPEDGSYSQATASLNGITGERLSAKDEWKAWAMLGLALSEREDLDENRRELCDFVAKAVFGKRNGG